MPQPIALLALVLALFSGPARADTWETLRGAQIAMALERHVLRYADGSEQWFTYGGMTGYRVGWPNVGQWRVRDDSYCSRWEAGQAWTCFVLARSPDGQRLRFIDAQGRRTEALVLPD